MGPIVPEHGGTSVSHFLFICPPIVNQVNDHCLPGVNKLKNKVTQGGWKMFTLDGKVSKMNYERVKSRFGSRFGQDFN